MAGADAGDENAADAEAPEEADSAYGWLVVAAAFVVNLIADGVTFSFGILLTELFQDMESSREQLSWIGSFLAGVPLLLGPVASILIDRFGCRAVTMLGGCMSGVGFALMFVLPPSPLLFILSAGLLSGLGLGLCYMPAVVVVAHYFLERRALATGIAASGSGVGTVAFAYVARKSLELHTWRGAFLLQGGLLLNICVCGAVFRPRRRAAAAGSESAKAATPAAAAAAAKSLVSIPTFLGDQLPTQAQTQAQTPRCQRVHARRCPSGAVHEAWDSCPELPPRSRAAVAAAAAAVDDAEAADVAAAGAGAAFNDARFLFSSWDFLGYLAANFLLYFWYDIAYTFLPDHAKDVGVPPDDVSLVIGLIGVFNTVGQIAIGFVGDSPRADTVLLYALCLAVAGATNCVVPFCTTLPSLLAYAVAYGFFISGNYSLCTIVLIELFGLQRLNTGYGFIMFFQGLANLLGPPLIGHMRDSDSNYNRAFIYSGLFVAASNLLIFPAYRSVLALVRNFCERRRRRPQLLDGADGC